MSRGSPGKHFEYVQMCANMTADDLKAALVEMGWTQLELASRIETHRNAVNRWVNGKAKVPGSVSAFIDLCILDFRRVEEDVVVDDRYDILREQIRKDLRELMDRYGDKSDE